VRVNGSPRLSSVAERSRRAHTARSALIRASDDAQHTRTSLPPAQLAEAQTLAREWQAAFDARQE
jgi:hypothetical protein